MSEEWAGRSSFTCKGEIVSKQKKITLLVLVFIVGFIYFYDFGKNGHGYRIRNATEEGITIVKITNDNDTIKLPNNPRLPAYSKDPRAFIMPPKGGSLSVGNDRPGMFRIIVKNESGSYQHALCFLVRPKDALNCLFVISYHGNGTLSCGCDYEPEWLH